jgi:chromosomal replication initiator protein
VNAKQLWQSALERIRARVSGASYTTWFRATEGVDLRADALVVAAPNSFACEHLRQRFGELAIGAVADTLGRPLDVTFVVRQRKRPGSEDDEDTASELRNRAQPAAAAAAPVTHPISGRAAPRPSRHERRATLDAPHTQMRRGVSEGAASWPAQPPLLTPNGRTDSSTAPQRRHGAPPARLTLVPTSEAAASPGPASHMAFGGELSPRHTFESFVVGTTNRLAFVAAQQIAGAPGRSYNPLFIYGGTGLGKTHLLQAIGHSASAQGLQVCYVPAERFANDIIEAIRHHTTEDFRTHYRHVDVLLVDDVQFIAGKESTEEEFFHTFNALHDANRQIVLSSDRTPQAMHHLHDRLRSRFEWGLLADIQPPDRPHRLDILRAKAATLEVAIPDAVLEAIAHAECASVRELEGALNRVLAHAQVLGQPLDADLVGRALTSLRTLAGHEASANEVLHVVAQHFGVTLEALRGKARDHTIAWPRQVAMYLLREETSASLCQIGRHLGGRDHTTIMHGCAHVGRELAASDRARREVAELRTQLHG